MYINKCVYISHQPILCPSCKARCLTRSTAFRWPLFFWISGMLLIMFDALVPTGICVILFLRSLTPYSQEVEQKQSFRLHETTIFGFSDRPETNSSSHVFSIFYPSFGQSSASGSFKNLLVSGLYKLERHHRMNTYCVTEGCVA